MYNFLLFIIQYFPDVFVPAPCRLCLLRHNIICIEGYIIYFINYFSYHILLFINIIYYLYALLYSVSLLTLS